MSDFVSIAKVDDFREGKIRRYFVGGKEIGVVLWEDQWHAFSNRCTHNDFQMHFGYIEDDQVHCPIHMAAYALMTGKVTQGPQFIDDLPIYEVRVEGDEVQVSIAPLSTVE